jgi:hypothetical protein
MVAGSIPMKEDCFNFTTYPSIAIDCDLTRYPVMTTGSKHHKNLPFILLLIENKLVVNFYVMRIYITQNL